MSDITTNIIIYTWLYGIPFSVIGYVSYLLIYKLYVLYDIIINNNGDKYDYKLDNNTDIFDIDDENTNSTDYDCYNNKNSFEFLESNNNEKIILLTDKINKLKVELDYMRSVNNDISKELDEKRVEVINLTKDNNKQKANYELLTANYNILENNYSNISEQYDLLRVRLSDYITYNEECCDQILDKPNYTNENNLSVDNSECYSDNDEYDFEDEEYDFDADKLEEVQNYINTILETFNDILFKEYDVEYLKKNSRKSFINYFRHNFTEYTNKQIYLITYLLTCYKRYNSFNVNKKNTDYTLYDFMNEKKYLKNGKTKTKQEIFNELNTSIEFDDIINIFEELDIIYSMY